MTGIRWAALCLVAISGCVYETADPFRAVAIVPSEKDDFAFSQSMYDALLTIQQERGAFDFDFTVLENVVAGDAEETLRQLAEDEFDLVIAHGTQFEAAVREAARAYPGTAFALGTTGDTQGLDNLAAYEARAEEGGYVNGVVAARLSATGVLGVVGPFETGDAARYVNGFVAGARATVPGIDVRVTYVGSFDDRAAAAQAAQAHLAAGADVLTGVGQLSTGAIDVARDNDVLWFGTQAYQAPLAPGQVVASQVYRWEVVLRPMIDAVESGLPRNQSYGIGLAGSGETMVFNPNVPIPADVRQLADDTIARIVNGTLTVTPTAQ